MDGLDMAQLIAKQKVTTATEVYSSIDIGRIIRNLFKYLFSAFSLSIAFSSNAE
jgi:hypothetical protein